MKQKTEKDAQKQFIRASIVSNSFNRENKTFDVTFASETPVYRNPWWSDEPYNEVLSCKTENVRLERAKDGLPVFDNHYTGGVTTQLGRCSNIRFENKTLVGTVTLGARADESLIADIENGIVSGISVGYNVYSFSRDAKGKEIPTYTATDWEPMEISLAPVQADINSKIRSSEQIHKINIIKNEEMFKTIEEIRTNGTDEHKARLDAIMKSASVVKLSDERTLEHFNSEKPIEEIRQSMLEEAVKQVIPATEEQSGDKLEEVRKNASDEERKKLDAILTTTRAAKMEDAKAIEYYRSGKPIEEIRQSVLEEYVKSDQKVTAMNIQQGEQAIDKKRAAIEKSILLRCAPGVFKEEKKETNEFRGMSLLEIGKELLTERGINVRGMSKDEIARKLFTRDLSTSDFPLLLENVANKMLHAEYTFAPEYWGMIARQTSVSDFREKSMYQVGSANGMQEVPEGDQIKYGKLVESKQTIKVKSYGEGLLFTRQALINDDLSAFERIPQKFVLDWNTQRGDLVWAMITGNVKMYDGISFFHADHKNIAATSAVVSDASLTAALIAFKNQVDIDGKRKIRVLPKFLSVSPDYEMTARKILTVVAPTNTGEVNVWSSMGLTLIVEPRLTGEAWYLSADPNAIDGLYYANLDGQDGLRTYREENFDTDSVKYAVRGEFGVAAIDYRGWFKNAGK